MSDSLSNVTVISVAVTDQGSVCVSLVGDIDLSSEQDLAGLAGDLAAARAATVRIDLREITFAGCSLINFVVRLAGRLPGHATVTLCRPSEMILQMIEITSLHEACSVRHDLPSDWMAPRPQPANLARKTTAVA